jgi:hypothetical protein
MQWPSSQVNSDSWQGARGPGEREDRSMYHAAFTGICNTIHDITLPPKGEDLTYQTAMLIVT